MDVVRRQGLRATSGMLAGVLWGLVPAPVQAQVTCAQPIATATFFEVAETIDCNPGGAADPVLDPFCLQQVSGGFGTRIADARLEGHIVGPPGFGGDATIQASSVLSKVDWTGPAHGTISVDGSRASFSGKLDLSLARTGIPLAPISGKWHGKQGLKAGGEFFGMFFIPFPCPPESGLVGACYVRLDEEGHVAGFVPAEAPAGTPLVKLEITFCSR
jgi:hypothetical protein